MAGSEGMDESSKAEPGPSGSSAPQSTPRSVFLSYASQDAVTANTVCQYLESRGLSCWQAPRDVKPGAPYADAIVLAINDAKAVVLVLSGKAVASDHVAREVERAASKHKQIIALRIDSAALNPGLEYFLSTSQWIDVKTLGMPAALAKLAEAVGQGFAETKTADPVIAAKSYGKIRRLAMAAAVVIGVGVAFALGVHFWLWTHGNGQPAAISITDKSIAVLPFTDMSEKHDQEYFADGMSEEILNLLVKIPDLKVIGRTSSFQFKGKTEDLRTIGSMLGAAYVLEGSVRRASDHVRVTAQLIDTRDGTQRWSETYDRGVSDILKVQDEIAASLVRALQLEVVPSSSYQSRARPRNGEAYDSYLRGMHAINRYDDRGFNEGIADFRHALEIDPTFAPAADALAAALLDLADGNDVPAETGFEQARAAAEAALKLDPRSANAHTVLGMIHIEYDWDWPAAERDVNTAVALAPNNPFVLASAAEQRIAVGQWSEALRFTDAAIAADPLDANLYRLRGYSYLRLGRLAEAETAHRRALEISPTMAWGHYFVAMVLLTEGNTEAALAEIQKEPNLEGRDAGLVVVYQALQRSKDADAALIRLEAENTGRWPFGFAVAYAARGQKDRAFEWLDRAYAIKDPSLWAIKGHPYFKSLEGDPRYKAFLEKMNLPE